MQKLIKERAINNLRCCIRSKCSPASGVDDIGQHGVLKNDAGEHAPWTTEVHFSSEVGGGGGGLCYLFGEDQFR